MRLSVRSAAAVLALFSLLGGLAAAQTPPPPLPPGLQDLPIGFGPGEKPVVITRSNSVRTAPPIGSVRAAAEWNESQGVFCLWSNASLMRELATDNALYVITTNISWWSNWLSSNGVNMANVQYLNAPTNTFWVRDYGPWFIWDGNQDFGLIDTVYNRPRPLDDVIPGAISSAYGVPYFGMDLVHAGGNYYTDGYGNAFSSSMVYSENPGLSEAQVDQKMSDYLGIARYVTPDLKYDIEHFDTFGKPLAPDRMLWGSFPVNTTPWAWSEAAYKHYQTLQSPYGWPYKIFRIPLYSYGGSWAAYINGLQTNDKIIIPKYGTSNDAAAEAIIENAAPGYDAVLVASNGTSWGDSVHCRSRNFVRGDAVRIYPRPHWEATDDDLFGYVVKAEVIPDNSTSLNGSPVVYWSTTGGAPFTAATMSPTGRPFEYAATLPSQPWGATISYYYHAEDLTGLTADFPFVAPDGLFIIAVAEDRSKPELDHLAIHGATLSDWPLEVSCVAIDDTGIPAVELEYRINGVQQPTIPMVREAGTFRFSADFIGSVTLGDLVEYRVVATDGAKRPNVAAAPESGWNAFEVDSVKPVLVIELDKTPDSGERWLRVLDDLGLKNEYTTEWPSVPSDYEALVICMGMSPTHRSLTTAQASSLVSYLAAGGSAYLEGGNAWAQSATAGIYRSYFGVSSASSGATIYGNLLGVAGCPTEGMVFDYQGEATSSDDLSVSSTGTKELVEGTDTKAITAAAGAYHSVGTSFQFGGLVDGTAPGHAKRLAAQWLDHLGLGIDLIVSSGDSDPTSARITLEGDPGARYLLLFAYTPGHQPRGAAGILKLDPATARILAHGVLPPSGRVELDQEFPWSSSLLGSDVYFQAHVEDVANGGSYLTNRDRLELGL